MLQNERLIAKIGVARAESELRKEFARERGESVRTRCSDTALNIGELDPEPRERLGKSEPQQLSVNRHQGGQTVSSP